ncbi:hypothetical protein [Rufibacter tibetensis]|uniref:Uncharacterized protein n=1 Tax=Rufibacter tibetensis TaxID=512763 RepID=A0A0P0CYZ9_9BACT|nr:hypothetical protein [Rufibacter tibetensis]ALI99986.1 hypothetical protein DC20_14640 [Rufibacter tibetensis]
MSNSFKNKPIFHYFFSSPIQAKDIDLGTIEGEKILPLFQAYPWRDWLQRMKEMEQGEIHFSPTLNFENKHSHQKMLVSALENGQEIMFYVFYQRPKTVKRLLGLWHKHKNDYTTELLDKSPEQTAQLLEAFVNGNYDFLESTIKY